jgi:hypothetical protein
VGSSIDAVRCAIEQLPAIFREVILLCDVEDASYREIAEILSIPIGIVCLVWPDPGSKFASHSVYDDLKAGCDALYA